MSVRFRGLAVAAMLLGGCTFVGHVTRFSEPPKIPICAYVELGVAQSDVESLLASVNVVRLHAAKMTPWVRAQGTADDILASVPPPDPDCRWSIGFARRPLGEIVILNIFGGVMAYGAADGVPGTRAYVYVHRTTLLEASPRSHLEHEILHLSGCKHWKGCDLRRVNRD